MKKIILSLLILFAGISKAQLKVTSSGAVGIGTSSPYYDTKLDIRNGNFMMYNK